MPDGEEWTNLTVWEGAMGEAMGQEYQGMLREVVGEGLWRKKVFFFKRGFISLLL
ncbi:MULTISPECIES: hypothetical protein [unclassified Bartonella]|uniref:hypothetical protein n=1 Tax=unclassified Bartonella TaxID=2645622 RepID=UPI0012947C4B|nr:MULTISPECIES: hypothetical protein [unclassified Bartonella]